ncbi:MULTISPECIES: hypothetical protein [Mesorhizobium]|jgi:hypothetical protein|uniref:hypothetical protein n=1 Tax=Mesorhizobium sp. TaxID=1871066 RepID=UPI000493DDF7|nr:MULTISPECIES: hypothetical protein [Mesorhizobium]RWL18255.1 MAG: hypothetical protein EOR57_21635 [Mesorhizobium sp.]RWM69876.1 MAG: hypothetical protein EOR82_23015 [Mesorhizobium sp.]TIO23190.1 MAG: hypothetical protein E5X83_22640 [Mesorhizobium sp.]TJV55512.1 MAG: hypothetical protein E5X82_26630 [Mesorhizobium sp.]
MPLKSAKKFRSAAALLAVGLAAVEIIGIGAPALSLVSQAEARVGQPWTPRSAAGVARRTTWRVLRHTTAWVPALPAGCVRTKVNGFAVWRCGGTYYRAYQGRYIVVVVD